ncbi:MAG TPA: YIP1 family protein [Acholeplasmataceae bacterium]|nr:YIP1 family protein [Acholeplasmataceae bacterium]
MYSNLLKLLIRNQVSVINKDVINVPVNQYYSNPPFTKETYIVLTIRFLIRDVRIDRKLLLIHPNYLMNTGNNLKKYKLYQELTFAFTLIRHPFDGFYGIKKENRTSVLSATILLFLLYSFYIASLYFTGFLFSNQLQSEINLFEESIKVLVPFGLFVIANYLVCSIREGEGRFSHVYQASVYMLAPLIIAIPFLTLISNALTLNERFIYEFGTFVTYFVVVIYIILMVKEIHNYSFSSAIGNIFLSIFTALMIAVVVFIVYLLVNEILSFLINIWIEVRSRG